MNVGISKAFLVVIKTQVGGCQVPGLKVAPDPVGSEDLKKIFCKQGII